MISFPSAAVLVTVLLLTIKFFRPAPRQKLPPGPPGLPILGNALQLPKKFVFLQFAEWSKIYGPIFTVHIAGRQMVVLNSVKVAGDVLDRLSAQTSDRPRFIKLDQFLARHNNVIASGYTEGWRRLRKATHEILNTRSVQAFRTMQQEEALITVHQLLTHPNTPLQAHFHRTSASIAWRALYGGQSLPLDGHDGPKRLNELLSYIFQATQPGQSLMDLFPPLRHLYANVKWMRKHLDDWYLETTDIFLDFYQGGKDASALGARCVSNSLNRLPDEYNISHNIRAWTVGSLFGAGQETSASALRIFVFALVLHPEVVKEAHSELDRVVGGRPPSFEDKDSLPYITAAIKEAARWRPTAPGGLLHAASDDFEYQGYVIPKGTWIFDNIWSQTHDPAVYPDPERFDPTRFLDADGKLKRGAPDTHDDWLGFGHGRRVCPGKDLAINSLFITCACLLWAFDIRKAKDGAGREVEFGDMDLEDNFLTVQPAPFKVDFVPRFGDLETRLREAEDRGA